MNEVINFFDQFELDKIGIGSSAPIDINRRSNTYGYITTTSQPYWENFNDRGTLQHTCRLDDRCQCCCTRRIYGGSSKRIK